VRKSSNELLKQRIPEFLESLSENKDTETTGDIPIDLLQQVLIEVNKPAQQQQQQQSSSSQQLDQSQPSAQTTDYSDLIKKLFKDSLSNVPEVIQPMLNASKNFNLNNLDQLQLKYLKVFINKCLYVRNVMAPQR
jgi:hypothetical protein